MFLIRTATNPKFGKGHISRCKRIRSKIKSNVIWFIDNNTTNLYFDNSKDKVVEEKSIKSFAQLKIYASDIEVKAIIIDTPILKYYNFENNFLVKPVILLVDSYLKFNNTLSICMHPMNIEERNFISGFKYFPLIKKKKSIRKNSK